MLIVIGVAVVVVAAGAIVWAIIGQSSAHDRSPGDSCVDVAIASSMGGGVEHTCGAAARDWCRAVSARHDAQAQAVQAQCRVAGILPSGQP